MTINDDMMVVVNVYKRERFLGLCHVTFSDLDKNQCSIRKGVIVKQLSPCVLCVLCVGVCVRGKTPSTADLSIENYPQTADVPAMGDRPRLRSWFSPYKIYDVGGVWILDVAACSQHRVDQFYVYREMSQRPLRWLRGKNALPAIIP